MELHHIEIHEEIRDHDGSRYYKVADYPKMPLHVFGRGEESLAEMPSIKTRDFEVIKWHIPGRRGPTYFGIEKTKVGLFDTLARISAEEFNREMELRRREWRQHLKHEIRDREIARISKLPWYKRLSNQLD